MLDAYRNDGCSMASSSFGLQESYAFSVTSFIGEIDEEFSIADEFKIHEKSLSEPYVHLYFMDNHMRNKMKLIIRRHQVLVKLLPESHIRTRA